MKIAIITLPLHTNYGGILQAYALQTVLERMGHQVEHLQPKVQYPILHPMWKMPLVWTKRMIRKILLGEWQAPVFEHPHRWIRKYTDRFIKNYIKYTELSNEQWNKDLATKYDAFIVGSDQVWRSAYAYPMERYFLSFLPKYSKKLRLSYAASFGVKHCDFTPKQLITCKPLMQQFDFVSVREQSGIDICKQLFNKEAIQLIDPTLLLKKEDYLKLTQNTAHCKGNLLSYILDQSTATDRFTESVAKHLKLTPFIVNSKCENHKAKITERRQPPVEQWLRGFIDAEFVVTDSFHGCIFSIIFEKPFLCIGNTNRGSERFDSLFKQIGLKISIVDINDSIEESLKRSIINWDEVNCQIEKSRNNAINCLIQILNKSL